MGKWHTIGSSGAADIGAVIGDNLTPPGNVTIGTITARYRDVTTDGTPDREGLRELILTIPYTPPSPIGTFKGVQVWIEYPDQSGNDTMVFDGLTPLDGTKQLAGAWKPENKGKHPYVPAGNPPVQIRGLRPTTLPLTKIRVYLASYSSTIDNPLSRHVVLGPNLTPSATVDVGLPDAGVAGAEHCKNVTDWDVTVTTAIEGGIDTTTVICSFTKPNDPRWTQVRPVIQDYYPTPVVLGVETESPSREFKFPTPTDGAKLVICYGVSGSDPAGTADPEDDSVNTIVHGFTPHKQVTIGGSLGTIDAGQLIASSVGAALQVVAGVLGVSDGGITEDLIGVFAVSQEKLANAQIIDAARIVDLAVQTAKLDNLAITTPKIFDLAVTNAKLDNLAVTTAKINDLAVTNAKLDNLAVTNAKMGNAAVGTANIQDLAVTTGKINNLAVTNALIANLAVTEAKIGNLAVTDAKIANATISNAKIISLTADKITAGTITASVTMTSPTIIATSGSVTVSLSGATKILVTDTFSQSRGYVRENSVGVESTVNSSNAFLSKIGTHVLNSSGSLVAQMLTDPGGALLQLYTDAGSGTFEFDAADGKMINRLLPSSNPGAGTKRFWYDPAAGNIVKYAA